MRIETQSLRDRIARNFQIFKETIQTGQTLQIYLEFFHIISEVQKLPATPFATPRHF